jgi:lipopolysaccharide biosynthesis regulator YciM
MYKFISILFLISSCSWNIFGHGDLERRIHAKTKAIALDPQNASLYVARGFLYHQHEEWDNALADYLQAEKLGLQEKILYYRMAETYLELYLFKSGLICTQQYLAQDSLDVKIHKLRGELFYKSRAYDDAIYSFEYVIQHSIDLTPENYVTLAEVYAMKNPVQKEAVFEVIERGLENLGTKVFVLQEQKLIYFKKFNLIKQAIAQYDVIINNSIRKEGWHYKKANYLYQQKKLKEAKIHAEAAKEAFEGLKPSQQKTKVMLQLLANIHTLLQNLENK